MKQRNPDIDLFKFIYSLLTVGFHFFRPTKELFVGGNVGVEFFLLVSGMFLFQAWEDQCQRGLILTPNQFFVKRFKRLFPWSFTAFVLVAVIMRGIISPIKIAEVPRYLYENIWEILLLNMNGLNQNRFSFNSPAWTMSSMLIAGFVFWALLYCLKDKFLNLILPISLIVLYGVMRQFADRNYEQWIGFTTAGTIRAIAIMGTAYYCWLLSKKLQGTAFNLKGKKVLTFIELLCHGIVILISFTSGTLLGRLFSVPLLVIAVAVGFSGHSQVEQLFKESKMCVFLGKVSISTYLVHWGIINLFAWHFGNPNYYEHKGAFVGVLIAVVLVHYFGTEWIIKGFSNATKKIVCNLTEDKE